MSSSAAHVGEPTRPAYATTKVSLHALTRHVARRWGRDNVRCNAVAPGPVFTETTRQYANDPLVRAMVESNALGRAGAPEEVAAVMAFLLSDDGAWVTGQVWSVGGGFTMRE
jgi:NAD(P)-dependent dehydrogenase (short-subunit alcohol dehydrogenase family)